MKQWKSNLFTIAGVIVVGYILFIMAEVMDALYLIFTLGLNLSPILFILFAVICFVMGKRQGEIPRWREWCLRTGSISAVAFALYVVVYLLGWMEGLTNLNWGIPGWILIVIIFPVILDLMTTIPLAVFVITSPNKWKISVRNIFLTLAIIVVGGYLALWLLSWLFH